MNRADFVAALAAAAATPAGAPHDAVRAEIAISRDGDDLLAPFTVAIAVRNPTSHTVALDFPTADIYRIDVRYAGLTVWSTATGHKPLSIARRIDVAPGVTRLASQTVDGTTDDRRAFAPGRSIVRVALLGTEIATEVDEPLIFAAPLTVAATLRAKRGTVVTTAGTPSSDGGIAELRDAGGSLRLSRPLGIRPAGTYVVRGYLDAVGDDVQFAVGRFAPAYDNDAEGPARPTAAPA